MMTNTQLLRIAIALVLIGLLGSLGGLMSLHWTAVPPLGKIAAIGAAASLIGGAWVAMESRVTAWLIVALGLFTVVAALNKLSQTL